MLCKVTELLCGLNFSNESNQIKLSGKRRQKLKAVNEERVMEILVNLNRKLGKLREMQVIRKGERKNQKEPTSSQS